VFHSQYEKSRTRFDRYHNKYGNWRKEYTFDAGKKGKQKNKPQVFFKHTVFENSLISETKNTKRNNIWMDGYVYICC